jgi:deoxyhypusine synthase
VLILEEDVMNLVAHNLITSVYLITAIYHRKKNGHYLEQGYNRVTDTCIPEEEAFRRITKHILVKQWKEAEAKGENAFCHTNILYQSCY